MRWQHGCLAIICSAMCACHTAKPQAQASAHEDDASWHLVDSPSTPRYQLSVNQTATGTHVIARIAPVYPPEALAQCAPSIDVQAQLVIDEAGHVSNVRVSDEAHADEQRRHYIDAVRKAAAQWVFNPLQIDKWVHQSDGTVQMQSHETKPFSLIYAFHFECHDGHVSTSMDKAPSP